VRAVRFAKTLGGVPGLDRGSALTPSSQGQDETSRRFAERHEAVVQIEARRLFILSIDDKRVNRDIGPPRTLNCIPQQGASELTAMVGDSDRKAPQTRDRHHGIAWQTFGESHWHPREENPARGQCVEPGNAICRDLPCYKTRRGAAPHILAGLLEKIAIERIHAARKPGAIVVRPKWLNAE